MPTLHLIDADSTQACPAVMALVADAILSGVDEDRLLLIGGPSLEAMAKNVGISHADRVTTHYGVMTLVPRIVRRWMKTQPKFDRVHAWSVKALLTAGFVFKNTPIRLTLVHALNPNQIKQLRKFYKSPRPHPVRVLTHSQALCDRLASAGIKARVDSTLIEHAVAPPPSHARDSLRAGWHTSGGSSRVVALLSDHPSQVNAMDATAVISLLGASLPGGEGRPLGIKLVMLPGQLNRQRAQYFLADKSDHHRVIQDVRAAEPWKILSGCDAALALGPDAGGLSLHWALGVGVPVITADIATIDPNYSNPPHLHIASSPAHKDLAHKVCRALNEFPAVQTV